MPKRPADTFYYYAGGQRIKLTSVSDTLAVSDVDVPDQHRDAWNVVKTGIKELLCHIFLVPQNALTQMEGALQSSGALRTVFRSGRSLTLLILIPEVRAEFDKLRKEEVDAAATNITGTIPSTVSINIAAGYATFIPSSKSSADTLRIAQLLHERHKKLFLAVSPRFLRVAPRNSSMSMPVL